MTHSTLSSFLAFQWTLLESYAKYLNNSSGAYFSNFVFTRLWNFVLGTGKVILESAILTTVVVLSLTFYTFWAAKKGYDFNFLGPFLFGAIIVLMVFALIQVNNRLFLHFDLVYHLNATIIQELIMTI